MMEITIPQRIWSDSRFNASEKLLLAYLETKSTNEWGFMVLKPNEAEDLLSCGFTKVRSILNRFELLNIIERDRAMAYKYGRQIKLTYREQPASILPMN